MPQDWAYLGQKDFVNNAVMSTSRPGSPFMQAYLSLVVGEKLLTNHYWHLGPVSSPKSTNRAALGSLEP